MNRRSVPSRIRFRGVASAKLWGRGWELVGGFGVVGVGRERGLVQCLPHDAVALLDFCALC
jgi:hypothetical protein